ncbi:MAG: FecR family protein [Flavisolibacter sp.]
MELPEDIFFLMSRSLSGEASSKENELLRQLLQEDKEVFQQYELLKKLWKTDLQPEQTQTRTGKIAHILQLSAVEDTLKKGSSSIITPRVYNFKIIYRFAAILIGIMAFVWLLTNWTHDKKSFSNEIVAQKGSRTRTILPDGSTVWVNAGSRISYGPEFNNKNREIILFGEAYFDVVKDMRRPFIVHAGQLNIKVLGTLFNVKSYPEDKSTETTLIRGLVQITMANSDHAPIYLHPNQKITLPQTDLPTSNPNGAKSQENIRSSITRLDSNLKENERIETAWVYNRLEFRGDDFSELAKKLERWYNISIHFEDNEAKELTFNGSLENETASQAFRALQIANSFNFKIKDNEIFISSSGEQR